MSNIKLIAILDNDSGNLTSLKNTIDALGYYCKITNDKKDILNSDQLIIAGASNVDYTMQNINNQELNRTIKECYNMQKPILGICAGMQIMFNKSEENKKTSTLNILSGEFKKIPNQFLSEDHIKVPNTGLFYIKEKKIQLSNKNKKIYDFIVPEGNYYFQHSYYLSSFKSDITHIDINYHNIMIPALVAKENFLGLQFHPEISGRSGIKFINDYLKKTHKI